MTTQKEFGVIILHQADATPIGTRLKYVKTDKLVQVVRRDTVVHYFCWNYNTRHMDDLADPLYPFFTESSEERSRDTG